MKEEIIENNTMSWEGKDFAATSKLEIEQNVNPEREITIPSKSSSKYSSLHSSQHKIKEKKGFCLYDT